jgi:hypothetical protein
VVVCAFPQSPPHSATAHTHVVNPIGDQSRQATVRSPVGSPHRPLSARAFLDGAALSRVSARCLTLSLAGHRDHLTSLARTPRKLTSSHPIGSVFKTPALLNHSSRALVAALVHH